MRTEPETGAREERRAELAARLAALRDRIGAACDLAGRARGDVTLIAVTKTFPVDDVRLLADLGVTEFGENRDQEARGKAAAVPDVRWHFVGQLQRNKAARVASYADVVHSVDRPELVAALDTAAARRDRVLEVLVQVDLDAADRTAEAASGRGGTPVADVPALADVVAGAVALRLRGVMAVAPRDADPDRAFALLERTSAAVRASHPRATVISAGMSGDLEAAIRNGATHVRVGTALLGGRVKLVR